MTNEEQRARAILSSILFDVGAAKVAHRIAAGEHVPKYDIPLRAVIRAITTEREELLHDLAAAIEFVQGVHPTSGYVDQDR